MRELIKIRNFKAGYQLRTERVSGDIYGVPEDEPFEMTSAYTPDGHYIGNPKWAYRLCKLRGIKPELAAPDGQLCSVGFCEADQKWYGWSHRAIYGFGIGDMLFEEEYPGATDETPFSQHGHKAIATLEEARQAAVNFADYVG